MSIDWTIDSLPFVMMDSVFSIFFGLLPDLSSTVNNIFSNFEKGTSTRTVPMNAKIILMNAIEQYRGTIVSGV